MTIDNLALVRATNIIPFDGIMKPISETPYLIKNTFSEYSRGINQLLQEEGIIPSFDFSRFGDDQYTDEYNKMVDNIMSDYIPYSSDYNSMILFSLNGLVPDDSEVSFGNNTFSNKKCAVIDGLSEHIDQVVSLVPTDTAIKGSMQLSPNAIVLLEEKFYESIPDDKKQQLFDNGFTICAFEGNLKEAVKETLSNTGRYIPEELSLSRQDKGYRDSETKEATIQTIDNIAKERNIAQVLHFDVLTGRNNDNDKLTSVENEYNNIITVNEYYQEEFYNYLFENMMVDEYLQNRLISNQSAQPYIKELCDIIKNFGIENYKQIVMSYNEDLERKQMTGELLTPEEIVSIERNKKL